MVSCLNVGDLLAITLEGIYGARLKLLEYRFEDA
jgi:hypothetical protein